VAGSRPGTPDTGSSRIAVPKLNRDPIQSLRPFPVDITLGGHEFTIPALPASAWLTVLMTEEMDFSDILPGLLDEEQTGDLEDMILDRVVSLDELEDAILGVLEIVSARDWWVALRLILNVRSNWDVIGAELGIQGIDATHISLSSWLDVVLILLLRAMDQKDIQMFTMRLEAPPPEAETEEADMEMSSSEFMAMAR
jgi:hypothetical protein